MGKRAQKGRTRDSSSENDAEDPSELLAKLARQRRGEEKGQKQQRRLKIERAAARANGIFITNPLNSDEVLLFGGEHFDGNKCHFHGDTLVFNAKTRTWTDLDLSIAPSPRSAHQAVPLRGSSEVLLFGGEFGTSKETKFLHFSDTWIFDFASYAWHALTLKEHPASRSGHRMATWGDFVVLFGGFQDTGKATRYLDDLWLFDIRSRHWIKVDWMNEYEGRPSARSGFSFQSHPEGILLYGGYTQVKGKSGAIHGQTLNDLWLLRLDTEDEKSLRWKKLKLVPGAPSPRSGSSSVLVSPKEMLSFGGVIDEEVSDEHLIGTCVNSCYRYTFGDNSWEQLDLVPSDRAFDMAKFCGRFNSMLAMCGDHLLIYGGIYEVGDRQFTLDDMYQLDPKSGTLAQLQSLSPELEGCWNLKPTPDDYEDDDDGDDNGDDNGDEDEDSEGDDTSGASDDDREGEEATDGSGKPIAARYKTLKEFFDSHVDYWMDAAKSEHVGEEVTEKQLRSVAFMIAKRIWSEQQELEMNICL